MLRTLVAVLLLAATGLAISQDEGMGSALVGDDECVAGADGCGLNALQRRTEKVASDDDADEASEEAVGKPVPDDVPLRVLNNASNSIVLANCQESYEVKSGEEIQMSAMVTGGFWVLPAGFDFNCSQGCADCFYIVMAWTVKEGASVRIGFGLEAQSEAEGDGAVAQPQGGGMSVNVSGSGSAQCTDGSCEEGWTDAIPVDLESSIINIVVQGSDLAKEGGGDDSADSEADDGVVDAARFGRGRVFRRPVFRRPVYRRPIYRRPIYRRPIYRRPIYRPIYRRPVYYPAPVCSWCYQYGAGTCWWLCR